MQSPGLSVTKTRTAGLYKRRAADLLAPVSTYHSKNMSMMIDSSMLPSFLGGVGLALSAHALLAFNGSVFGISGFIHRGLRGAKEGAVGVLALVAGGLVIGLFCVRCYALSTAVSDVHPMHRLTS